MKNNKNKSKAKNKAKRGRPRIAKYRSTGIKEPVKNVKKAKKASQPKKPKQVKKIKKAKYIKKSAERVIHSPQQAKVVKVIKAKEYQIVTVVSRANDGQRVLARTVVEIKPENVRTKEVYSNDNVRTGKVLGYCNGRGCSALVTSLDLESKRIFICTECNHRDNISKLKKK